MQEKTAEDLIRFVQALYAAELVHVFDWQEWTGEARRYVDDPQRIETADLDTIQKLITVHVRNDRFVDNHLAAMITNGHMAALLKRLQAITQGSNG